MKLFTVYKDHITRLEALCEQLIQKNHLLRERANLFEWAVVPAADDMNIETDRAWMEKPKEGVSQEDYIWIMN